MQLQRKPSAAEGKGGAEVGSKGCEKEEGEEEAQLVLPWGSCAGRALQRCFQAKVEEGGGRKRHGHRQAADPVLRVVCDRMQLDQAAGGFRCRVDDVLWSAADEEGPARAQRVRPRVRDWRVMYELRAAPAGLLLLGCVAPPECAGSIAVADAALTLTVGARPLTLHLLLRRAAAQSG